MREVMARLKLGRPVARYEEGNGQPRPGRHRSTGGRREGFGPDSLDTIYVRDLQICVLPGEAPPGEDGVRAAAATAVDRFFALTASPQVRPTGRR